MKTKIFLGLLGALVLTAGCVGTVTGGNTTGTHWATDKLEGVYPRSVDECFAASKAVVAEMGVLTKEGILHSDTNHVKIVEGKINERKIWIRVEPADPPQNTSITVQARTSGGHADIDMVHQVEKNIALKLVR
jgi:hypothetical protein